MYDESLETVVVSGAGSVIGPYLLVRLTALGHRVIALSRAAERQRPGARLSWHHPEQWAREQIPAPTMIHLAPLWTLPPLLAAGQGGTIRRVIAFSSTSRLSKLDSTDAAERRLAQRLADAEQLVMESCARYGIAWTMFRPTLIYADRNDPALTLIARFIERFGFFPVAGKALGLRQPVHADDLAAACMAALHASATHGQIYALSGGETLRYRALVARIATACGRTPRLISVPIPLYKAAVRVLARVSGNTALCPGLAVRMNQDLCFDHSAATRDFGYRPRPFEYRPESTQP